MAKVKFFRFFILFFASVCSGKEIPLEDFFKNPEKAHVTISPNGNFFAYLAPWEHRLNLFIETTKERKIKQMTHVIHRDITKYSWVTDDKLIYEQDVGGDENDHLFLIDQVKGTVKDLTPFEKVKSAIIDDRNEYLDGKLLFEMNNPSSTRCSMKIRTKFV